MHAKRWRVVWSDGGCMLILGLDPGASTGLAVFVGGELQTLQTISPLEIERKLRDYGKHKPARVIFEDSRLQSRAWTARSKGNHGTALATARSLGQVDAWCSLITALCAELEIPALGISPAQKGSKLDAKVFAAVAGWRRRTNQHERDAAMVAWPYRGANRFQGARGRDVADAC